MIAKYDIDLILHGTTSQVITVAYDLEPFFSRVWLQSSDLKKQILQRYEYEHDLANELFNVTTDEWNESKHLCNEVNYDLIFNIGEPINFNVRIDVDLSKNNKTFFENIHNLSDILATSESGTYELDDTSICVDKLVSVSPLCQITNPEFDMNLLNIE